MPSIPPLHEEEMKEETQLHRNNLLKINQQKQNRQ